MGQEIAFEAIGQALESVRGTAITPPTHLLNMAGTLKPIEDEYFPNDMVGVLAEYERSEIVRKSATFSADGALDVTKAPVIANQVLAPVSAGVAGGGELLTVPVSAGGSGYTSAPTVTISAPASGGRQAVAHSVLTADAVTSVVIDDPGQHYTSAPTIGFTGGGGSGAASSSPTVSTTAATAKLWEFIRVMTSDTIKSATDYWGDPNTVFYKGAFGMLNTWKVTGNASGTDGVMNTIDGISQFPSELTGGSIPTLPAIAVGPLLVPGRMQFWLEGNTTNAFGTTAVTGRVVSAECTIPTGVTPKYVATGPAGGVTYDHVGRKKAHPEMKVTMELIDTTHTAMFIAGTTCKARVRFNGATAIEGSLYPFWEMDIQGKLGTLDWGDLEGTNRTVTFTIKGVYSSQIASDCRVRIQNSSASL